MIYTPAKAGQRVNVVLRQFPKAGTLSSFGHVTLVLAKPLHGTVPKVTGLAWTKASAKLQRLKLEVVAALGEGRSPAACSRSSRGRAWPPRPA